MKQFAGFPARLEYVPIPAAFFSQLLPGINDLNELKATLELFRLLSRRRGNPRYATLTEAAGAGGTETTGSALAAAVKRGTFISLEVKAANRSETIYLLNTAADREALEKIRSGQIVLTGWDIMTTGEAVANPPPNIYTLYENNIGLLTPLIAEELKDAEKNYPADWIEDAFKEAVKANKRNWRYVARVLERWATEGKKDGTYQRDTKKTDPDKYYRDEYGHLFQR